MSAYEVDRECRMWTSGVLGTIMLVGVAIWSGHLDAGSEFEQYAVDWDARLSLISSLHHLAKGPVVAHLQPAGFVHLDAKHDDDFGVRTQTPAFSLQRHVRYCQWQRRKVVTDHAPSGAAPPRSRRRQPPPPQQPHTFVYVKGWTSHRIDSSLFEDPFVHHNPMHDPFPPRTFGSNHTEMRYHHAGHNIDIDVQPSLLDQAASYERWLPASNDDLGRLDHSPAATMPHRYHGHAFRYIGGGRFYSTYHESPMHLLMRTTARVVAGTFDVTLNDMIGPCTAGDIEIHFTPSRIQSPSGITVAGEGDLLFNFPSEGASSNVLYLLREFRSSNGFAFSSTIQGYVSTDTFLSTLRTQRLWKMVPCLLLAFAGMGLLWPALCVALKA